MRVKCLGVAQTGLMEDRKQNCWGTFHAPPPFWSRPTDIQGSNSSPQTTNFPWLPCLLPELSGALLWLQEVVLGMEWNRTILLCGFKLHTHTRLCWKKVQRVSLGFYSTSAFGHDLFIFTATWICRISSHFSKIKWKFEGQNKGLETTGSVCCYSQRYKADFHRNV